MKITNPIGITGIGDPFVIEADGYYYLYATSFVDGFLVWRSTNLVDWEKPKTCYERGERSFGYRDFWAPEVIKHNGKFIMHYSARRRKDNSLRMGVAVADCPQGPFIDVYDNAPMFDYGYAAIDGHVFLDDGKPYFYYSRDCSENIVDGVHESHIYVSEMTDDLLSLKGEPKFLFKPEKDYENVPHIDERDHKFLWNEGPFIIKKDGKYHMTYSCNYYAGKDYSICAAVADAPEGPFIKYPKPLLVYEENFMSGPGHGCVINHNEKMYFVYHVHTDYTKPSGNRQVFISEIKFKDGMLRIDSVNE